MGAGKKEGDLEVASPIATGQGGGIFELHVGATWLSLLLVRAIPPLLLDGQVSRVSFQTSRQGWATDDILVAAQTGERKTRKLACQIKRKLTISSKNEECKKTFKAFWSDFQSTHFDPTLDRLCLITLLGTNTILSHFGGLLDCAAAAQSSADFSERLKTDGLMSKVAKRHSDEIRKILEENSVQVPDEAFWNFLRCLAVLSFDLNTNTKQTEAWIRTLLAQTANGSDKQGVAKATWNELVTVSGHAMPNAKDFGRDDLPATVRAAHEPISNLDNESVMALQNHSTVVLNGIRNSVQGKLKLRRPFALANSLEKLEQSRVLILSGPAGNGKSAVAKTIAGSLNHQYFSFAFRAEEFAKAHLDETLTSFGSRLNGISLSAILAGQRRKFILVESVERLLEASVRDAFTDLLTLIENDDSWNLIITCRSYSVDIVVASFFAQRVLPFAIYEVPQLSDDELKEAEAALPELSRPLSSTKLRKILRNPYVLDKAARMKWSSQSLLPQDEREFRRLFWGEIVRDDSRTADGLPARREQVLTEVALRRAKALTVFARADDLDQKALSALSQSDLISSPQGQLALAAPAHDLLEDWALLNWIDIHASSCECDPKKVAEFIGTYPALRRSYRLWLTEKSELEPQSVDSYVQAVLADTSLSPHFRDDTMVSLLKSDSGGDFVKRNRAAFVANDSALLIRVVQLLRVACKTMPDWISHTVHIQSSIMVPDGKAWPEALAVVREHISAFSGKNIQLAIGLIEDWSNLISINNPYPSGYQDAAAITFELMDKVEGYRHDKNRKKLFSAISKNPIGDKAAFVDWMTPSNDQDRDAEEFGDFLIEGTDGWYCAKDLPDELIELCRRRLYLDSSEIERDPYGHHRLEIDQYFGLHEHREFFPSSAHRGPFFPLLHFHFSKGLDFIIEFVNRACAHYADPNVNETLEPAWEVTFSLNDGTAHKQWHNPRLWQIYRGTSVAPNVVMCALMALERSLLDYAKVESDRLDSLLTYIIKMSNNSALSAVVASVVAAFPRKFPNSAKVLLRCRDFVDLSQQMSVTDSGTSVVNNIFPSGDAQSNIYRSERRDADALPHRRRSLSLVALDLQLTQAAPDIQRIIDEHLALLPDKPHQKESDRIWRLALHRMDLRKYSPPAEGKDESSKVQNEKPNDSAPVEGVILQPEAPESDLSEMIEKERPRIEANQSLIGLLNWSFSCFSGDGKADPKVWQSVLNIAMTKSSFEEGDIGMAWADSPAMVAAVCIRDHWGELNSDQKEWCLKSIRASVARDRDSSDFHTIVSRNQMSPDRACAMVAAAIVAKEGSSEFGKAALDVLIDGLFHVCEEVSIYAASGIGNYLWATQPQLGHKFVRALVAYTVEVDDAYELEEKKRYDQRTDFRVVAWNAIRGVRDKFRKGEEFQNYDILKLDFTRPCASEMLKKFIQIFSNSATDSTGKEFYLTLATQIGKWHLNEDEERVPFELVQSCQRRVASYVLGLSTAEASKISQPIIDLVESKPKESSVYLNDLIIEADGNPAGKQIFWHIWDAFAAKAKSANWLKRADSGYFYGDEILRMLFLGISWKKGARKWQVQEGFEERIKSFFSTLPTSSASMDHMSVYLYEVGGVILPEGFVDVAKKLNEKPQTALTSNAIFCLEQVLQRHVYGSPQKLKSRTDIRNAVIALLDALVERGSAAAFKMRDDFVTPLAQ